MRPQSTKSAPVASPVVPIELPRLSSEEGTATLSAWLVAVGDRVEKGGLIAELETDKATVELEAPVEGRIVSLDVAPGSDGLKPGTLLGRIEPAAAVAAAVPATTVEAPTPPSEATALTPPPAAQADGGGARPAATPLARRMAEARGVDLERLTGTGVGGRIVRADVERSASEPDAPAPASVAVRPPAPTTPSASIPSTTRPVAAPAAAVSTAHAPVSGARPPAHLAIRCAMDAIVAARQRLNAERAARGQGAPITLNDFIVRAAGLALRDVPAANRRRRGDAIEAAPGVDVALVVASAAGPRTAVLRDADRKGLATLSEEIRSHVAALRGGEGPSAEDPAASLLVTSFARFGIEAAYPMLPVEQVCVLGVGTVLEQPVVRGGAVVVGRMLSLTLGFDPGAVGGADAAALLAALRGHLEDPLGMML